MTIGRVLEFHKKFDLPNGETDVLTDNFDAIAFRVRFLKEELTEFHVAMHQADRVKALDALLDLAYVTYGTALFMGVTPEMWYEGMKAVHAANMAKERATHEAQSKRGSTLDVIKPVGWVGPESRLKEILNAP